MTTFGIDDRARADRRAGADRDERADRHVGADRRVVGDGAQRIDARAPARDAVANSETARANAEYGSSVWSTAHGARRIAGLRAAENHRRRARRRELRQVARVGDEGEIAGLRLLDAGDAHDVDARRHLRDGTATVPRCRVVSRRCAEYSTRFRCVSGRGPRCDRKTRRAAAGSGRRRSPRRATRARRAAARRAGRARRAPARDVGCHVVRVERLARAAPREIVADDAKQRSSRRARSARARARARRTR